MTREEARAKIQKLLALANAPGTVAEGEAALARAEAIASNHGFSIRKRPPGQRRDAFDTSFLNPNNVDRSDVERDVARFQQERRRRQSMWARAYMDGYNTAVQGGMYVDCPYKRRVVFGVPIKRAWMNGFGDGLAQKGA